MTDAEEAGSSSVQIEQESIDYLVKHAQLSIGFLVDRVLELSPLGEGGIDGISFSEVPVPAPWFKDYDDFDGEGPAQWPKRFDVSNWGLLAAYENHERVGGAVIACAAPGVNLLEGREDLAVLWDLRVAPAARGRGIGSALFDAAAEWARSRGFAQLKIETQNINVAACRFYARKGCSVGAINARAYPDLPGETQLLWYLNL